MKTILTTIIIVASISPVALGELTITVPNVLVSDMEETGSFEVFITTDETHTISLHQTRISISPDSSGITFTGVEKTTAHPYVMPDGEWFYGTVSPDGATIDVGDIVIAGTPPSLNDGAGLFKVNFDIAPGQPPYPVFDVTISTDPMLTTLVDGDNNELTYSVDNGEIMIERTGPHRLRVDLQGGAGGNWANETSTLLLTYGEIGASSGRADPGINGDVTTGWGNEKFGAPGAAEGDYGVYSRSEPFGSGDDMLVQDARALTDTTSNVLIEAYTNNVFTKPTEWVPGETWNEGGTLEFTVESDDKTYFDGFRIVQKKPGRFLEDAGLANALLGDFLDANGHGVLPFDRVGCDWIGGFEIDWLIGSFASFDLIPPEGTAWSDPDAPLMVEMGSHVISHSPTPEPSSFILLAMAGFVACSRRRKPRGGQK